MGPIAKAIMVAYYFFMSVVVCAIGDSRRAFRITGSILGYARYWVGYVGRGRSRKVYLTYMREALADKNENEIRQILKQFWCNHQKCLLELFLFSRISRNSLAKLVEFRGLEHLDQALKAGRGVVLAVPHFGNERFLHIALALKGYPMNVLSAKYDDIPRVLSKLRLRTSSRFHNIGTVGDDLRWMFECLKRNEILQIAPTGEPGTKGVRAKLLGQEVYLASGPARVALHAGSAFLPAFITRTPDDRHIVEILAPICCSSEDGGDANASDVTLAFARILEDRVRRAPEQFNWTWWVMRRQEAEGREPKRNGQHPSPERLV